MSLSSPNLVYIVSLSTAACGNSRCASKRKKTFLSAFSAKDDAIEFARSELRGPLQESPYELELPCDPEGQTVLLIGPRKTRWDDQVEVRAIPIDYGGER